MSKLTAHILNTGSQPAKDFCLSTQPGFLLCVSEFGAGVELQNLVPGLRAVGRIYSDYDANTAARSGVEAAQAARFYVEEQRDTYRLNPQIKIWTGPNEPIFGLADDPANVSAFGWYARFEAERVRLLASLGLLAVVGNFNMGAPDLPLWYHFGPAFDALAEHGGWLGLHEYQDPPGYPGFPSPQKTHWDEGDWGWFFLRCEKVQRIAQAMGFNPRVLITECGTSTGWLNLADDAGRKITPQEYAAWLARYDQALRARSFVDGAAIFTSGSAWGGFLVDNHPVLSTLATLIPAGNFITPDAPDWPAQVQVGGLIARNLRSAPGPTAPIVGLAWRGHTITVVAQHGDWLEARLFIHQSGVTRL